MFRLRERWRLFAGDSDGIEPHGRWLTEVDTPTRKVWNGYRRRVHLETNRSLGGGWRVWMDLPGDGVQYPIRVHATTPDSSGVTMSPDLELRYAREPGDLPTFTRSEAFAAAELFMTGYALDRAGPAEAMERLEREGESDE